MLIIVDCYLSCEGFDDKYQLPRVDAMYTFELGCSDSETVVLYGTFEESRSEGKTWTEVNRALFRKFILLSVVVWKMKRKS